VTRGAANGSHGPLRLVLATANRDKAEEIVSIVRSTCGDRFVLSARPEWIAVVEETGETLEDNARLKARAVCEATSMPAIADDTGLEVEALGGAPGVRSSRYSGEKATYDQNVAKLVSELEGVGALSSDQRRARFRTVAIAVFPDGREVVAEGKVEGHIATQPRGKGGFGYDPVFVPAGETHTFAEMTPDVKNSLSHRGRAFRALAVGLGAEETS